MAVTWWLSVSAGELDAEDTHRTLFVELDFDENCDELERLLTLVDVLKGSHCYDGSYYLPSSD